MVAWRQLPLGNTCVRRVSKDAAVTVCTGVCVGGVEEGRGRLPAIISTKTRHASSIIMM
jgi:hypothetical protein